MEPSDEPPSTAAVLMEPSILALREDAPSPSPLTWVMLDCCPRPLKGAGEQVRFAFRALPPPRVSRLYIDWQNKMSGGDRRDATVAAAHGSCILLSLVFPFPTGTRSRTQDLFVYQVQSRSRITLQRLPACGCGVLSSPSGEIGILRRDDGDGEFAVAHLKVDGRSDHPTANLCISHQGISWDKIQPPLRHRDEGSKVDLHLCSCSPAPFLVASWILNSQHKWVFEGKIEASEFWHLTDAKKLPRGRLSFPLVDMERPQIVHFLLEEDCGWRTDGKKFLVALNILSKELHSAIPCTLTSPYGLLGSSPVEDDDVYGATASCNLAFNEPFIPCEFSKYLDALETTETRQESRSESDSWSTGRRGRTRATTTKTTPPASSTTAPAPASSMGRNTTTPSGSGTKRGASGSPLPPSRRLMRPSSLAT